MDNSIEILESAKVQDRWYACIFSMLGFVCSGELIQVGCEMSSECSKNGYSIYGETGGRDQYILY